MNGRQAWVTTAAVVATAMQLLDGTVVNVSLARIAREFHSGADSISWVVTAYMIGCAVVMPLTGHAAARLGRKRLLLCAIASFGAASALCGACTAVWQLVACRALQGATGAALMPLSQAIIVDGHDERDRVKALAIWSLGAMIAPVGGPALGGILTETASWRWVFFVNVPLAVVAFALVLRHVPATPRQGGHLDWTGAAALAVAISCMQYLLDRAARPHDDAPSSLGLALAGAGLAVLVLAVRGLRRRLGDASLFSAELLADGNFRCACSAYFVVAMAHYGTLMLLPLFEQTVLHLPADIAGRSLVPRGLALAAAMLTVGKIARRVAPLALMLGGLAASVLGSWMLTNVTAQSPVAFLWLPTVLQGAGAGLTLVPLSAAAYRRVASVRIAEAAGLYNVIGLLGGAAGVAICCGRVAQTAPGDASSVAFAAAFRLMTIAFACAMPIVVVLAWRTRRSQFAVTT